MYTENGQIIDLDEVRTIAERADVFTVAFRLFPERLLIDTRADTADPSGPCSTPMVAIVDPVTTVEERFFWLGQHRPGLGAPQQFMFVYWPHSIRYLADSGVWDVVRRRIERGGYAGASETCDAALADLLGREREANVAAVTGERFHTVWSASRD